MCNTILCDSVPFGGGNLYELKIYLTIFMWHFYPLVINGYWLSGGHNYHLLILGWVRAFYGMRAVLLWPIVSYSS